MQQPIRRSDNLQRARELRAHMTRTERRMWNGLRQLKAEGVHFRRQAPFHGYILDFVCLRQRLVVELDGESHLDPNQLRHDRDRDAALAREGFRTLRLSNQEVLDLESALDRVRQALKHRNEL